MILVMLAISALPGQGKDAIKQHQTATIQDRLRQDSAKDSWSEQRLHRVPQVQVRLGVTMSKE